MDPKGTPTNLLSRLSRLFAEAEPEKFPGVVQGSSQDMSMDPAAIKERIRRKKRDDAIRKMEFNSLRKILRMRSDAVVTPRSVRPRNSSFNPISEFHAEARASTLIKIEEAEAQLTAWWNEGAKPTQSAPLDVDTSKVELDDDIDLDFTHYQEPQPSVPAELTPHASTAAPHTPDLLDMPSILEELPVGSMERALRDAAVVFAEGDSQSAKQQLLALYQEVTVPDATTQTLVMALFEVLRYLGDQEAFNALAMRYAEQSGMSPPEWYSLPEVWSQRHRQEPAPLSVSQRVAVPGTRWICPAELRQADLWAYMTTSFTGQGACNMQWDGVRTVHEDAADLLLEWTDMCVRSPLQIQWTGLNALIQALRQRQQETLAMPRDGRWWRIHMNLLCIARCPDDFEEVAIDYCIATEVSPPSWVDPVCIWNEGAGAMTMASTPGGDSTTSLDSHVDAGPARGNGPHSLYGDVVGDAAKVLQTLEALTQTAHWVTLDCRYLGRVDFNAANALFNWVQRCQQQHIDVEFQKLPRLVLIFLHMVGLDRHATLGASMV